MADAALLNVVLFLPLLGIAALLAAARRDGRMPVRRLSLGVMLVQFAMTAWLYLRFDAARPACSSRRGCRGFPAGACTTRSVSTATTCCWSC